MASFLTGSILLMTLTNAQAVREDVVFNDYVLFKIPEGEVGKWDVDRRKGQVIYECDVKVGCEAEVDSRTIGGTTNVYYTCDKGAKIRIEQGLVFVPPKCDGSLDP